MRRLAVTVLFAFSLPLSGTAAQAQGAPNCALFTSMSEEHGKKAQAIEQEAAEQAKTLTGEAAKSNADISARAAKSEWEMAALSREAGRKCLQDYLSPSQATIAVPAAPVQQAAPAPVVRQAAPVVVRQPAPVVRQAAPAAIEEVAPMVVEQAVRVPQFHATAVSAMAAGGAALAPLGNGQRQIAPIVPEARETPGTTTTRNVLKDGTIQTTVKRSDGTEVQTTQRPGETGPSFIQTSKKNADGSGTAVQRSHAKETSAVTSGTIVTTKSPGGKTTTTIRATERNSDGTIGTGDSTITKFGPSGATVVEATGRKSDGTVTTVKQRELTNHIIQNVTTTNPDGTVSQKRTVTSTKTGVSRDVPVTTPSSNPPSKMNNNLERRRRATGM